MRPRRVRGIGIAIIVLLAVLGLVRFGSMVMAAEVRDSAREVLDTDDVGDVGVRPPQLSEDRREVLALLDEQTFRSRLELSSGMTDLVAAAWLAVVVLTIIWLYQITSNHVGLGRKLRWSPGWAIGGWFLPPIVFVIPLLMLNEAWKASGRRRHPGRANIGEQNVSPLPMVWFIATSVMPALLIIAWIDRGPEPSVDADLTSAAQRAVDDFGLQIVGGLVGLGSAFVWALLVWRLGRRHMILTGERVEKR